MYEYECTACKHRFERLQKFSDEPAKVCVRCGAPVIRLLSSPAIQFKGTGWYVTDYGKSGSGSDGKKDTDGKRESKETKDSAESKPAAADKSSTSSEAPASSKADSKYSSSSSSETPAKT